MKTNPYLFFSGQCEEAFKFYEQLLGGRIVAMMRYAEAPQGEGGSPDERDLIMHARMLIGDQVLMASDAPGGRYHKPQGFSVSLNVDTAEEAERIFAALAEGGTVQMPIAETFWATRFGATVDRFGTPWMVNCEKPMPLV